MLDTHQFGAKICTCTARSVHRVTEGGGKQFLPPSQLFGGARGLSTTGTALRSIAACAAFALWTVLIHGEGGDSGLRVCRIRSRLLCFLRSPVAQADSADRTPDPTAPASEAKSACHH